MQIDTYTYRGEFEIHEIYTDEGDYVDCIIGDYDEERAKKLLDRYLEYEQEPTWHREYKFLNTDIRRLIATVDKEVKTLQNKEFFEEFRADFVELLKKHDAYIKFAEKGKAIKVLDKETGRLYDSIAECARNVPLSTTMISRHCKGEIVNSEPRFEYYNRNKHLNKDD